VGRFEKGLHNGPPPFGYCRGHCAACTDENGPGYCYRAGLPDLHTDKHLVPHPVDSLALQYAFEQYNTGDFTDKEIAGLLNAFRGETPDGDLIQVRSRGKMGQTPGPFSKDMIRDLLQNPFYAGVVPYYGSEKKGARIVKYLKPQNINEGLHLPLISQAVFQQALQIRAVKGKMPRGTRGGRNPAHIYVLQGLPQCARCGAPMHAQMGGGRTPRFLCSTRIQHTGACDQKSVKSALIEADLATELTHFTLPEDWQEDIIAYLLDEEGLSGLLARRQALEEHFQHVRFLYEAEQISRQQYRREWQAYQRQSRDLDPARRTDLDLDQARDLLADTVGEPITAFRAPSFSITKRSLWALDILAEEGFRADSSVFPTRHDRYGIPQADPRIHQIATPSGPIWELPPAVARLGPVKLPASGGGYFRLYPVGLTLRLLSKINRKYGRPFVFYVHPWEVDQDQPRIATPSRLSRARHYLNLATTEKKLERLLGSFRFGPVREVVRQVRPTAGTEAEPGPVQIGT